MVCVQSLILGVTWQISESSQPFTSTPPNSLHHSTSRSLVFLSEDWRSLPLTSHFPPCLCAQQTGLLEEEDKEDTFPFTLFHPFVQGWTQVRCLFNAVMLELISDVKFPSFWLGSSRAWGAPTLECLRSCADYGELRSVRGLGGSRVWVGPPVSQPILRRVLGDREFKQPKNNQ